QSILLFEKDRSTIQRAIQRRDKGKDFHNWPNATSASVAMLHQILFRESEVFEVSKHVPANLILGHIGGIISEIIEIAIRNVPVLLPLLKGISYAEQRPQQ